MTPTADSIMMDHQNQEPKQLARTEARTNASLHASSQRREKQPAASAGSIGQSL